MRTPTPEKGQARGQRACPGHLTIAVATFHRGLPLAGPGGYRSDPPVSRPGLRSSCLQSQPPVPTRSAAAEAKAEA